ncbi:uncharacterized protein PFL1_03425 [Pseudozyma flocculosa PF-1]|uniref:Large ribosomal subunit protein mL49 n=2 Tax=Pseudozyma flocculosa TaxID=84751 RepID=A0A5C3F6Y5_9BASI|nr:uncharacterized protein PFL1_03425 [Pseudozyma flocculosa PF-1]EPQ29137.1 hypothetical protein PFL1_03425 [Pseudozyma flocculosa PF-1]SPO40132.1 uncharacterized protein PSFLO_05614 [Pseudozyma flocculosa]
MFSARLPALLRTTPARSLTASYPHLAPFSSTSSSSSSSSSSTTPAASNAAPHSAQSEIASNADAASMTMGDEEALAATAAAAGEGARAVQHPYFVPRIGKTGDSLPVYTDIRNGGTRVLTEIRKVQGDVEALRKDLLANLHLFALENATPFETAKKPIKPRAGRKSGPQPGHPTAAVPVQVSKVDAAGKLVVKGNKVREVKAFLEAKGF